MSDISFLYMMKLLCQTKTSLISEIIAAKLKYVASRSVSPNCSVCDHICRDLVAGSSKDTEGFPKHQIRYWHSRRSTKDSSYIPKIQSRSWKWPDAKGRTFTSPAWLDSDHRRFMPRSKNPLRSRKSTSWCRKARRSCRSWKIPRAFGSTPVGTNKMWGIRQGYTFNCHFEK